MLAIHENKQHGKLTFPYTVYGGRLPEWLSEFPLHWHDEMEIIYVLSGSVTVGIQNEEFLIKAGETALIQPQFVHSIRQDGEKSAVYFNILFRLSMLDSGDVCMEKYLYPIYKGERIIPKHLKKGDILSISISPYIKRLAEIAKNRLENYELLVKSYLLVIMHYLCSSAQPESSDDQRTRELYDKLKKALDHIRSNYTEEITVEKAAALCNFSASHFSKMFRQLTGISFTKYLINYRLETAAKKLADDGAVISDTAFACGFNNLSYFTRAFKNKYGMTPHEYRRKKHSR